MTTSSVYSNPLNRDALITAAIRKLGVLAEGQTPSAQNLADGQIAMNMVISQLKGLGMPLWARSEYTFTPSTSSYSIGVGMALDTPYPVKMLQAYRTESTTKIPMELVAREDFNVLPVGSTGSPLKLNYQSFVNYGIIGLWPAPGSTNTATVTIVYQRPFQYLTASTQTLDFPEEWYTPLVYYTAVQLAPEWGVPLQDRQLLLTEAKAYVDAALNVGQEDASFFIQPERRM